MSNLQDQQIAQQIEGMTRVSLHTADFNYPESFELYLQGDQAWVRPLASQYISVPLSVAQWISEQFTDEQQFNTDPEVIRFSGTYDQFWNHVLS